MAGTPRGDRLLWLCRWWGQGQRLGEKSVRGAGWAGGTACCVVGGGVVAR